MTCSPHTPGFEWKFRDDAWGTHQPVLYEAICRTKGPIVELGCGYNSTHLIHSIAEERAVYSLEHDLQWLDRFRLLETDKRKFIHIKSWSDIMTYFSSETDLSVVFVDQGDWESRKECVKFFKERSEIVLVHDSDYLMRELGMRFEAYYKFIKTFFPLEPFPYHTGPPTTIMSNSIDVSQWNINYEEYK